MPAFQSTAFLLTLFVEPHPTWSGVTDEEKLEMHYDEARYNASKVVEDCLVLGFTGQLETCPTTQRLHLQAVLRVFKRQTATAMAQRLREYDPYWHSVHLVGAPVGDLGTLSNYTNKERTRAHPDALPFTYGVVTVPGSDGRTGEEAVRQLVRGGAGWAHLLDAPGVEWSALQSLSAVLPRAMAIYGPKRDPNTTPEVYLLVGESGTGKSVMARELCTQKGWKSYSMPFDAGGNNTFVTEDVSGKDTLILEDFRGQGLAMTAFLNLVDRGPFTMQTKGGMVNIVASRFIITSNVPPVEWWAGYKEKDLAGWEEKYKAVKRRLDEWTVAYNYKAAFRLWRLEQRLTGPIAPMWADVATRVITPIPL